MTDVFEVFNVEKEPALPVITKSPTLLRRVERWVNLKKRNNTAADHVLLGTATEGRGNLWTSEISGTELHAPVLDLDIPHKYVASTTAGHGHLYIDVPMTWDQYRMLLTVLGEVGILEPGYVDASIVRKFTAVRKPEIKKAPDEYYKNTAYSPE